MSQHRTILHVDMDAFYASVEILDNPALAGKPVIVGGTPEGRGVVAAASYAARKYGVHSAMSAARAHTLCPHGVFIPPRMARYVELSRRIRGVFERYTPQIEPLSLDEAFLDVSGSRSLFGSAEHIGREIKRCIRDELGLVASVGVAPNKFLAKLASDLEKPDGFVVIDAESARERIAPLPVGRIWGVGKKSLQIMRGLGIHTVGDVARVAPEKLEARFGAYARRLQALARGEDNRRVVAHGRSKSMSAETTFATDISDAETLRRTADTLCDRVARRIRTHNYAAGTITLKARYANFKTVTRSRTFAEPTRSFEDIRAAVRDLLEKRLGRGGRALRLLGVGASGLIRISELSGELFEDPGRRRERRIDIAMDALRTRYGGGVIFRGNTGPGFGGYDNSESLLSNDADSLSSSEDTDSNSE